MTNPDGSDLQKIATPEDLGLTQLANPEWSADGRRIVMEMSNGSAATTRMVIVNADGSDLKDLGPGARPTFSVDGSEILF